MAQLEAIVGSEEPIKIIARDLIVHFEERLAAMDGKAMVVWHEPANLCGSLPRADRAPRNGTTRRTTRGVLKVVMTGLRRRSPNGSPISATSHAARRSRTGSAMLETRSASSSCATCG